MSSLSLSQTEALVDFLRAVPLFSQLTDEDLQVLIPLATRETYPVGRDVYRQSDDPIFEPMGFYPIGRKNIRIVNICVGFGRIDHFFHL